MKKLLSMLLAASLILGLTGCRRNKGNGTTALPDPYDAYEDYDQRSMAIYRDTLAPFLQAYQQALEAESVSQRYALMAVAEAELLASAVMLPLTAGGGSYTITRAAPYTLPYAQWGNDADRLRTLLVATSPIEAEDVAEMKTQWAKLRGTGEYAAWARNYLLEEGYTLQDSYRMAYTADPKTWDALATSRSADAEAIVNTYDGLYEYDCEGTLQPALAKSHTVRKNDDGTVTYSFALRPGVKWVDSQGRVVADMKADDFVAGFQHMLDAAGGLEYLVEGLILGATEYISGQNPDFSHVGVTAPNDATVEYTLISDEPYFMTMLGYGVFAPMSRSFYQSKGGRFGREFDPSAASYTYGNSPDAIAYCGPYLVSSATAENSIVFTANPAYWNEDGRRLQQIIWRFNDGKDALKTYHDTLSGVLDGTALNPSSAEKARTDGTFEKYAHVSARNSTTYFAFCNLDRQAMSNFNDGAAASSKDAYQNSRSRAALRNVHFRRALAFAVDRGGYNAQTAGEDLRLASLRNSFVPGNFVTLPEETQITVGNRQRTYPAGTLYGQIVQDRLNSLGLPIKVFDPNAEHGAGSSDGFDGWYNPQAAMEELEIAMQELGLSPENPIYLDLPYFSGGDAQTNRANAYKQSVERTLGGAVRVQLVPCADSNQVYYAGYYISAGYEANYDIYDLSGWGPDYGDPKTYLGTLLPGYEGYMTRMLGIF